MRDKLILITAGFPFGNHETFLETEIIYLSSAFKKIIILSICDQIDTQREIPENCQVYKIKSSLTKLEKIKSVYNLINKRFWQEIQIIRKTYQKKVSIGIIKTMLISLYNASRIQKELIKQLEDLESTICYSYWCDDTAISLCLLKEKKPNIKAISRMHRWDIYFEQNKFNYLPFRHFICDKLDMLYPISVDGLNYVSDSWKVKQDNFKLARLGVFGNHSYTEKQNSVIRIVSCSNVIKVKRVDKIAEAISLIKGKEVQWIHYGDGPLLNELQKLIENFPEQILVSFPGRINNKEILRGYLESPPDLFINLSCSEGIPVSIMEAMSFGIPVIATDVGGNAEIVNNKNGSLLPEDSTSEEVSNVIQEYFDLEIRNKKGKEAFNTWKTKFNAKENYNKFLESLLE